MATGGIQLVRKVAVPFLVTRCTLLFVFLLTVFVSPTPDNPDHVRGFTVQRSPLAAAFRSAVTGGDSVSYVDVAENGYRGEITRVYPPAFPMALRAAAELTGEYWLTGCMLSSLFMLAGLAALFRLSLVTGLSNDDALRAVWLSCIFPGTHFMSLPFAESMLFAAATWAIVAAMEQRWLAAALFGILASITKVPGSLVAIPLAVTCYQQHGLRIRKQWLAVLCVPTGMAAYLAYLFAHHTLDFAPARQLFGHQGTGFFLVPVWQYLRHPNVFSLWNLYPMHFCAMLLMFFSGALLLRRGEPALGLYALACVLFPLTATQTLASLTRYALPCCSVYVALAIFCGTGQRYEFLRLAFTVIALPLAFLYALHYGIAMM